MRRTKGFTLIEFAVIMVIIGLLMTAVMPDVTAWLRNLRIRNQAESIQNGLQRARAEAVRRNQSVTFYLVTTTDAHCAVSNTGTSWVVMVGLNSPAGKCDIRPSVDPAAPNNVVDVHSGQDGGGTVGVTAKLADNTGTPNSVTFDAFGRIDLAANATPLQRIDAAYATVVGGDRLLRVELQAAGQIRMCDNRLPRNGTDARECEFLP